MKIIPPTWMIGDSLTQSPVTRSQLASCRRDLPPWRVDRDGDRYWLVIYGDVSEERRAWLRDRVVAIWEARDEPLPKS